MDGKDEIVAKGFDLAGRPLLNDITSLSLILLRLHLGLSAGTVERDNTESTWFTVGHR